MPEVQEGYVPVPFNNLSGGLNLRDQVAGVQPHQAIAALDVLFLPEGAVRSRPGYFVFTPSELTNQPDSMAALYTSAGIKRLVVGNGNRLDALDTSGESVHNATTPTASPHFFSRFGGPGAERLYIANGTDLVRYYDGTAFTTPSYTGTNPDGKFLAVTPWDNRLLNARRTGTTGGDNPSSVRFSAVGDPHTWDTDDWNDMTPGDGEEIMGMIAWREFVFVFKQTKFFVVRDTGVSATNGDDTLVYYTVDTGIGAVASKAICAGPDGVYFLARTGVYRTAGGEPQLVSSLIEPIFDGNLPLLYVSNGGQAINHAQLSDAAMWWYKERIYIAVATGGAPTNTRMLVYDPRTEGWTVFSIAASALTTFRAGSAEELMFGYATGGKHVAAHSILAQDSDAGAFIPSMWRQGYSDLGSQVEKVVREVKLRSSGAFAIELAVDLEDAEYTETVDTSEGQDLWEDGTNPDDLWEDGTNPNDLWSIPATAETLLVLRGGTRGTTFSLGFRGTTVNRSWVVYSADCHVREARPPSFIG